MKFKQFYNIATKVSSRKKCYYFWWSTWLLRFGAGFNRIAFAMPVDILSYEDLMFPNPLVSDFVRFNVQGFAG